MGGEKVEIGREVISSGELVGTEELPGCETDEWVCGNVEMEGNSNVTEEMGKVDKGVEIGIGNDTIGVPLVA